MKRSEINQTIETAKNVLSTLGIYLPTFAYWTVNDWEEKGLEVDEIRKAMLGWDVTDFGKGQFNQFGRTLFTLRNGYKSDSGCSKIYAEKVILNPSNQRPPLHFHQQKMEDIINRGGGNILIQLYKCGENQQCSNENFTVDLDGIRTELRAGSILRIEPGQSICIPPCLIHQFWGEENTGITVDGNQYTVSGEVSSVCNDWYDNQFLESVERFPDIEEDEPRYHYLCNEYPSAQKALFGSQLAIK